MTLDKAHLAILGAALIAVAVLGKLWLDSHDAKLKAEATNAVLQKAVQDSNNLIAQSKADQQKIAADLSVQLSQIARERTIVVSPQQAAQAIPQIVPNLPQPVQVVPEKGTPVPEAATTPGSLIVPKEDIPNFQTYVLDCKEKGAKLDACTLNQAAMQTQLDAQKKIAEDYEAQANNWKKAAQGTFWHRLGSCGVRIGVGAAAGAIGGNKQGAAIGGGIGLGSCFVWK